MKYLIRANKFVFSGNKEMLVKYMSDFYKSESKQWLDKDGNCIDFGKFKSIIGNMGYEIRDKIPSNCRCAGTAVSIAEFKKICAEKGFSVKKTAERLHITEKLSAQLARKLKIKK